MTDFNELVGITVNSLVINEDKTCLVFRSNENVLYFYESEFKGVRGVDMFDDKYGNLNGYQIVSTETEEYPDVCSHIINFQDTCLYILVNGPIKCLGIIEERILKDAYKFSQLVEDF